MRLMGLDVGDKTIGVAMSDELEISAQPVTVIRRTESIKKDLAEVKRIAEEYNVAEIIVGMPFMLNGSIGIQAEKVLAFVEMLKRRVRMPIILWDERLSTSEAERVLIAGDQSRAKRKLVIDKLAATLILTSYMNSSHEQKSASTDDEVTNGD